MAKTETKKERELRPTTATIEGDYEFLIIKMPIIKKGKIIGKPSKSGNTTLIASTGGNVEIALQVNGQNLRIGANAYIYPE